MDATAVEVKPETMSFYKNRITGKRKRELRYEVVKRVISEKPAGTRIKLMEFGNALGIESYGNLNGIIKTMLKNNIIGRVELSPKTYSYYIKDASAVTTTPPSKVVAPEPIATEQPSSLADKAKEFAWKNNTDSLRAFIDWLDGRA